MTPTTRPKIKKNFYPNTEAITEAFRFWEILKTNLPNVMNQSIFQKKLSMNEKLEYLKRFSIADVTYWECVYHEYPGLKGKRIIGDSIGLTVIQDKEKND